MKIAGRVGHNSDCAGYDWTVGEVYGIKSFNRDERGRLVSPQVHYIWKPGENVSDMSSIGGTIYGNGFYAYTSGKAWAGDVRGIIKGYGYTTEGDRGFQCEKAEIVALVDKSPSNLHPKVLLAKVLATKRWQHCYTAFWAMIAPAVVVTAAIAGVLVGVISPWFAFAFAVPVGLIAWWLSCNWDFAHEISYDKASYLQAREYLKARNSKYGLAQLYPNAKIYRTYGAMLRDKRFVEYKKSMDAALEEKLPDPNDEEFWK